MCVFPFGAMSLPRNAGPYNAGPRNAGHSGGRFACRISYTKFRIAITKAIAESVQNSRYRQGSFSLITFIGKSNFT
jgi:hypothetical protein